MIVELLIKQKKLYSGLPLVKWSPNVYQILVKEKFNKVIIISWKLQNELDLRKLAAQTICPEESKSSK